MESLLGIIVVLLVVSVGTVAAARALKLPPLVGYLVVGLLLGPHALALAPDTDVTRWLAEIGVVFLMFSIGLEFSLPKLRAMRSLVFGLGGLQVGFTVLAVVAAVLLTQDLHGMGWQAGVALGGAMAMSSTAMVMRLASDRGEIESAHGRPVVGVLLFQDLAVVPLLVLIPALAGIGADGGQGISTALGLAFGKSVLVLAIALLIGQRIVRPWLTLVARRKSQELFTLNVLLMTLGLAWITEHAGLSLALGAFLAGMLISETEFRYQVEADVKPYRDVLMGLFFISVGMLLDFEVVTQQWALIAALVVGPMIFKFALISALAKVFRVANGPSLKTGLWLCQAGEFGFVLLDPAGLSGIVPAEILQPIQAAMVISMLLAPFIIERSDGWILRVVRNEWLARSLELHRIAAQTMGSDRHVIVCGFGRCGQNLAQMLDGEKVPYVALDLDPQRTREAAAAGQSVVFGDAARKETLVAAGIHRANTLVITYADRVSAIHVIHTARHLAPALPIVVRSRDDGDLDSLRAAGATEVIPEVVEGSLMLASHALALAGVPLHRVIRRIREVRDTRYAMLRGYFHGSTDDANERGSDILLKSFSVPVAAGCVGQHLEALGLIEISVEVNNIRRGRMQLELDQNLVIQAGDVIVMRGSSEALAIAEELLSGRPA
ncbi:MAG: cation:proton antiporter [Betaproteobacteria bacterium]|nr:cation:proton antiporter [Betaproteobacteria bacterium]